MQQQANRLSVSCIIVMNMATHRTLCESPVSARIGNAIVVFLEQPKHISERQRTPLYGLGSCSWSGQYLRSRYADANESLWACSPLTEPRHGKHGAA